MRIFEIVSRYADDPELGGRYYLNLGELKERFPSLAPLVEPPDFYSIKYIVGLHEIRVAVCSPE